MEDYISGEPHPPDTLFPRLSNSYVEGFNSLVQAAKAKARGNLRPKNLIAVA